jgi:uncharacterized protein (TIGR02301 family)
MPIMTRGSSLLAALLVLALSGGYALAQDDAPTAGAETAATAEGEALEAPTEPLPPIYEDKLLRLSEILGSLTFLRDLCGDKDGGTWRAEMSALLESEQPAPQRRQRLIARFNHGFETFHAVYRTCTPSAELAIAHYLTEGEAIVSDVRSRYSQ